MNERHLLFLGMPEDKPYLSYLKPLTSGCKTWVSLDPISTRTEVEYYCRNPKRNISGVLSTSHTLLQKITGKDKVSLDAYSGSYFSVNGIEYTFLNPLEQVHTVPYGKFLLERFTSKLTRPESWLEASPFKWQILTPQNWESAYQYLSTSDLIAEDIETFSNPLSIRCVGFCGGKFNGGGTFQSFSFVLPINTGWALDKLRSINKLSVPKIFQNGKYDCAYLSRYDAVPDSYYWDTANLFHSWYSELPKDLAFLQSFFVREASYWKDLAESSDLETYYLYNAKDCWATLHAFLAWMKEAPQFARNNYLKEFPLTFPCHLSEMTGIKRDSTLLSQSTREVEEMIESRSKSLDTMLGVSGFNVNSSKQMRTLLDVMGCKDISNADDKALAKVAFRHPLNNRIINRIRGVPKTDNLELMGIRALRKVVSTYLVPDKDFHGRVLYTLNPHGTDSSRLSSREHHFWCGLQLQNIPVGKTIKQSFVADDGFYFGECDLEQAETRDTAYITGDENLIRAVNSEQDFHSLNTAAFFGVSYQEIYDDTAKKTKNKPLRDLAKRVNHGANYNMGASVMVDTMGEEKIYEAARLLKLRAGLTAIEIAQYLLDQFAKAYPVVRHDYQKWVVQTILETKMLVGATGWTRYCFSNPKSNKHALNSYIAHSPQSLNAQVLNMAFMNIFNKVAMSPAHGNDFKLLGQIHDSCIFLYREGREDIPEMVRQLMEIPITIKDIKGFQRTFTVPAALKLGKYVDGKLIRAKRWSDTE